MDRVRKALDLARLERAQASETKPAHSALSAEVPQRDDSRPINSVKSTDSRGATATNSSPSRFVYSVTRVFAPQADTLERNRISSSGLEEGAGAAFRMLRTQVLQRMDHHGWRTLAIFSPGANDGKTTMAANLAISLASDLSHSALLVEFDFRRPTLAARFGLQPEFGSEDVISGKARVQDGLYHPECFDRFALMPARTKVHNSSELLAGPSSRDLVNELRSRYTDRIVLFDLPPVLTADDALAFAPLIDCGLVVAAEGRTRRKDLLRTMELLHKTPVLGTVLNRAADTPSGY